MATYQYLQVDITGIENDIANRFNNVVNI